MAKRRIYTSEAEKQAEEATYRNAYQATSPDAGRNQAADNFLAGASGYPEYNNSPQEWTNRQMATPAKNFPPSPIEQATLEFMAQKADEAEAEMAIAIADPVGVLRAKSTEKDQEVSLKTLSKKEKEKILLAFTNCRDIAKRQYREIVEPEIKRRRKICEADEDYYKEKFPQLSKFSKYRSKDVKGACQWILPGLLEAFTGSECPLTVKGVNIDDDPKAEKIQMLLQYQLEKKNQFQPFCHAEIEAALQENWGIAKVWWKREETRKPMEMLVDIQDEAIMTALMNSLAAGKIDIVKVTDVEGQPNYIKLNYDEIVIKTNHPVLEFLPSSELRYTPDAPDLQHCKFVAQRKVVNGDYLKRKERDGIYENIDKALKEYSQGNIYPEELDRINDPDRAELQKRPSDGDMASKEVELYEAYLSVDYNNDGIYEKLIVHAIGDTLIRVAVNDFEEPPFYICSAFYDPNAVFSRASFSDYLEQYQDVKTALIRQIIVNQSKNNTPRVFVNERNVDMECLLGGDEIIPVQGDPTNAMSVPPQLQLSQSVFEVLQFTQSELEALSGSTRYSQGLDSNSLNRTATGITAIMGASEKRNKLIARSIAEHFFIPIYKFLIRLNQKYLEDEQMVRLTNESVNIRKEELDIDYDLIVNVGQGAGSREQQIQYLIYVLQSIYPSLTQQGIVNSKSWYNLVCKLLEALGLRDVSAYLMDPDSPEAQQAAQQAQQAAANAQAQALQTGLQLAIAKSSVPRVSLDLNSMPPEVQVQYLKDKLGIRTTEANILEHEVIQKNE